MTQTSPNATAPAVASARNPKSDARGVNRRTIIAGAAWSVPAVALVASTPALANSTVSHVSVSGPVSGIPADAAAPVSISVRDAAANPIAGAAVSLTAPAPGTFSQPNGTTDGSGSFSTTFTWGLPWATPGSTVLVTASSGDGTASASLTVLGANVLGFGYNSTSELGDGGASGGFAVGAGVARSTPSQLSRVFPSPVVQVVSCGTGAGVGSNQTSIALLKDGSVWAVGGNGFGQLGNGASTRTEWPTWARVVGLSGVTQISAGAESVYALLSDGTVMAWGDNSFGQLGSGVSGSDTSTPTKVAGVSSVTQIAAGTQQVFFLLGDGTVRGIGRNTFGAALGDGSSVAQSSSPVQVANLTDVTEIAGYHQGGYALKNNGTVWAWGSDYAGALGKGTTPVPPQWSAGAPVYASSTPVAVQGVSGVARIAGSIAGGVALTTSGAVYAWGDNSAGFVGDGTTVSRSSATAVSGLSSGVTSIAASGNSAYAITSGGAVVAWGDNSGGQLGNGSTTNSSTPVNVSGLTGLAVTALGSSSPSSNRMYTITT